MAVLNADDLSKVIGYYAKSGNAVFSRGSTGSFIAGTPSSLKCRIDESGQNLPHFSTHKIRVSEIKDGLKHGKEFSMDKEAHDRYVATVEKAGLIVDTTDGQSEELYRLSGRPF